MTAIDGTYTLLVDACGSLRLQMHGAPRSIYVGGLTEVESSGDVVFVPYVRTAPNASESSPDESS